MKIPAMMLTLALIFFVLAVPDSIGAGTPVAQVVFHDTDGDGIPDLLDSCPDESNIGPLDRDGDLIVDHCDLDPDNSGQLVAIGY